MALGLVAGGACGRSWDYPWGGLSPQGTDCWTRRLGPRWLAEPEVAGVVVRVLREGAAAGRYDLASWVLMPNHVHVLLIPGDAPARQIGWLKGRTAFEANRVMKRSGSFRAKGYFDRWIRNRHEWEKIIRYVEGNPVKAGLCQSPEDREWSSARRRRD